MEDDKRYEKLMRLVLEDRAEMLGPPLRADAAATSSERAAAAMSDTGQFKDARGFDAMLNNARTDVIH